MTTFTERIPRTRQVIQAGVTAHLHIGAQVLVSLNGEIVADLAIGESRPGVAMVPDTLMVWLSSTKPIAAVCIAQLWERALLGLDDLVAKYIPEFANGGKESITIRHLLTHTCGIRSAANNFTPRSVGGHPF